MNSRVEYTHIHFGAGQLGLGLIVPLSKKADNKIMVLNPTGNKQRESIHNLLKKTKTYTLEPNKQQVTIDGFHLFSKHIQNKFLQNVLTSPSIRLLTTAVTDKHIPQIAEDVAKIIEARRIKKIKKRLIIIACENVARNSNELKLHVKRYLKKLDLQYLERFVSFCDCVVDRICPKIEKSGNRISVVALDPFNLVLNKSQLSEEDIEFLTKMKDVNSEIQLVDNKDFQKEEKLKLWCFNGVHLALTLNTVHRKDPKINQLSEAINDPNINMITRRIQNTFSEVMISQHGLTRYHMDKYNDKFIERIRNNTYDKADRIIRELTNSIKSNKLNELDSFLKKLDERIIDPAVIFFHTDFKEITDEILFSMKECAKLLSLLIIVLREQITGKTLSSFI